METAEGSELDIVSTRQWLVWTGISDTFNPNSAKKAINGVAARQWRAPGSKDFVDPEVDVTSLRRLSALPKEKLDEIDSPFQNRHQITPVH